MEDPQLILRFNELVDRFAALSAARQRVGSVASRFSQQAVADMIDLQRREQATLLVDIVDVLVEAEARLDQVLASKAESLATTRGTRLEIEELDLRALIGEGKDNESARAPLVTGLAQGEAHIATLSEQILALQAPLERWSEIGQRARVLMPEVELELELELD